VLIIFHIIDPSYMWGGECYGTWLRRAGQSRFAHNFMGKGC